MYIGVLPSSLVITCVRSQATHRDADMTGMMANEENVPLIGGV